MLLTIDVGNTNLTIGLFEGESLTAHWRLASDHQRMPDEYGLQLLGLLGHCGNCAEELDGIVIGSVVPPLTGRIVEACRRYLKAEPLIVEYQHCKGIQIQYENPKAVGADRLIDALAVKELYSIPACVVDFGTATTFDAIDRGANYLGGAITPGIGISADALFAHTSKLTRVDLSAPPSVIGRNTVHAIQSGLLFGYVSLVEGMVARFRKELGEEMTVIGTGGLAEVIAEQTDCLDVVDPWLTLKGLRLIWEMNKDE
ncbi:MAG: type III pantothenate kinase [Anaerolineaceae bacterium]|nr:type III pantothenate kinase [Anaerolineaceae bacterium]